MAVLGAPLAYSRRVALRGTYTITAYRGRLVATAWPRGHKHRPKKTELANREWLQGMVLACKYADPEMTSLVYDQVNGSSTLARDFLTMMICGTAFAIKRADGRWLLPIRFRRLMNNALDRIRTTDLGTPTRHESGWITTQPGQPGTVLTSTGTNSSPTWA